MAGSVGGCQLPALYHAPAERPSKRRGRYFIDVSYCQHGVLWPAYGAVDEVNREALRQGLDRGGRYRHLYDSTQFPILRSAAVAAALRPEQRGEPAAAPCRTDSRHDK